MPSDFEKTTLREYFESIVIAVILALFVRTWAVQAFKIPTGSMENNLLIGDHLLVNKFVFSPTSTAFERSQSVITDEHRRRLVAFLERHAGGDGAADQLVVKDPRSVWTQALWREATDPVRKA